MTDVDQPDDLAVDALQALAEQDDARYRRLRRVWAWTLGFVIAVAIVATVGLAVALSNATDAEQSGSRAEKTADRATPRTETRRVERKADSARGDAVEAKQGTTALGDCLLNAKEIQDCIERVPGVPPKEGRQGDTGATGAAGVDGPRGRRGRAGADGKDAPPVTIADLARGAEACGEPCRGQNGTDGRDGRDADQISDDRLKQHLSDLCGGSCKGNTGDTGAPGADGAPGAAAPPPTQEQVDAAVAGQIDGAIARYCDAHNGCAPAPVQPTPPTGGALIPGFGLAGVAALALDVMRRRRRRA